MSTVVREARRSSASTTSTTVRRDFPILGTKIHGKPLVYLDNAASAQKPSAVIEAERRVYETCYANIHRGVHWLSVHATDAYDAAREKARAFLNAAAAARDHLRPRHDRGHQPRRPDARPRSASAPATRSSSPASSTTRTSCPGRCCARRRARGSPSPRSTTRASSISRPSRSSSRPRTKIVSVAHLSNALGTIIPVRRDRRARARARRRRLRRRRAGGAAPAGRRAGPRLRLLRLLGPQDLRPDRRRRALRQDGAPRGDAAVPGRRRHDPLASPSRRRPTTSCRTSSRPARPTSPAASASAPRSTTSRRSACRRSRRTSATCWPTRPTRSPRSRASGSSARRGRRPASSPSCSTAFTRTTSAPSSTARASRSAPATTARSRSWTASACRRRRAPRSASTTRAARSTPSRAAIHKVIGMFR